MTYRMNADGDGNSGTDGASETQEQETLSDQQTTDQLESIQNQTQVQEIINVMRDYRVYFHDGADVVEGQLLADMLQDAKTVNVIGIRQENLTEMGGNLQGLSKVTLNGMQNNENNTIIYFVEDAAPGEQNIAVSSFDSIIENEIADLLSTTEHAKDPANLILQEANGITNVVQVRTEAIAQAQAALEAQAAEEAQVAHDAKMAEIGKGVGIAAGVALGATVIVTLGIFGSKKLKQWNSPEARERRRNKHLSVLRGGDADVAAKLSNNIDINKQMRLDNPELSQFALDSDLVDLVQEYNLMREIMSKRGATDSEMRVVASTFDNLFRKLSLITGEAYYVTSLKRWFVSENRETSPIAVEKSTSARSAIKIISAHIDDTLEKFSKQSDFDIIVAMKEIETLKDTNAFQRVFEKHTGRAKDAEDSRDVLTNAIANMSQDEIIEVIKTATQKKATH